jgi:hypothetical protein
MITHSQIILDISLVGTFHYGLPLAIETTTLSF